jgi:acetyl-CoA acetyltransferase
MIAGFASRIYKKYDGSSLELLAGTVNEALEMAKIEPQMVDGLMTTFLPGVFDGNVYMHFFTNQLRQYLGLKAKHIDLLDFGGASALAMIYRAEKLIASGEASTVLCIIGGKASPVRTRGITVDSIDRAYDSVSITPFDWLYRVYNDLNPVSDYALVAARHKSLYGTSDITRAKIAVQQRYNAKNNSKAIFRDDLQVEDVLASPVISDPLHLLEIVYPVDGFHVFVVTSRQTQLRDIEIKAYGEAHWAEMPPELPEITVTPASESSKIAGFNLSRVDAFELYDSFTITVILQLEDIGLAEKGKAASFIEGHDLRYHGDVPINTGGGSLNVGQPAYMSGGVILEEALLQLNEMASGHQVDKPKNVLLNGIGGWNRSHSVTLVLGEKN